MTAEMEDDNSNAEKCFWCSSQALLMSVYSMFGWVKMCSNCYSRTAVDGKKQEEVKNVTSN